MASHAVKLCLRQSVCVLSSIISCVAPAPVLAVCRANFTLNPPYLTCSQLSRTRESPTAENPFRSVSPLLRAMNKADTRCSASRECFCHTQHQASRSATVVHWLKPVHYGLQ